MYLASLKHSYFQGLDLPWMLMENENYIIIGLKVKPQRSIGDVREL